MAMRGQQDKEIEIPTTTTTTTTLGYNLLPNRDSSSSSSKLSYPTVGERSNSDHDHQTHTLIFNETSHHNLYPPPPPPPPSLAPRQPQRPTSDPDLSTPIAPTSNPPRTTQLQTATTSTPLIRYRECLRNHAARMGSHVVDGCGEFMASGEEGAPESLRCAACECHRNFHRKEVEGESQPQSLPQQHVPNYHSYYTNKHNGHLHYPTPSSSFLHHRLVGTTTATPSLVPPVLMAFGGPAESSSEDLINNTGAQLSVQQQAPLTLSSNRKRFRTKFSQHQKDRMMEFADKIDWKIQKHNEQEVQHFCSQVGVKRQVFKVWMHNNKQTSSSKKQQM